MSMLPLFVNPSEPISFAGILLQTLLQHQQLRGHSTSAAYTLSRHRAEARVAALTATGTGTQDDVLMMTVIQGPSRRTISCGGADVVRKRRRRRMEEVEVGSALPDCSYACGSCAPCKRVTVSYTCSRRLFLPQSQPCPLAYRCMCNGHSYPIP
ncbi:hypothetical protein GOP47_0011701 [Adiantum capillus-veneris]|uniref:Epidermal patterning factor-like protein n=1 Tax=Adiantum capillus-veneris TaxID=13818 RepID=A0A9D4ZFM9_ADICA|nr:hypothetical protein GOP47_0011701 [Adiantum capillus-veneris]